MENKEICATGYTLYLSTHETLLEMGKLDPTLAFEYYKALANYNFYGEEYQGDNMMIKFLVKEQYVLIDKQRERYNKAIKGGQNKREQIPWEEIEFEAKTGNYTTLQSLGVKFGVSGQNIGKRFKYKGVTLQQLIDEGQRERSRQDTFENAMKELETKNESFETKEPKVSQVSNLGKLSKEERLAKLTEQSNE